MHIAKAKLGQADAGDNEAKLMTKLAPELVRISDPVIRSPARYRWTTAPAVCVDEMDWWGCWWAESCGVAFVLNRSKFYDQKGEIICGYVFQLFY